MNSKFLVLTGFLLFTFGCSHTNMEVAKTDIPEDDIIAGEPVNPTPQKAIANTKEKSQSRTPASVEE